MKHEITEIYTKSKTLNNITEVMKEINKIKTSYTGYNYEPLARYICEYKGTKYLAELDVPTKELLDIVPTADIEIAIYSFIDDDIKNYSAQYELKIVPFGINGNFKTAIAQMKKYIFDIAN